MAPLWAMSPKGAGCVTSQQPQARPVPPQSCKSEQPSKRVRLSRGSLAPLVQVTMAAVVTILILTALLTAAAFPHGDPHPNNTTASKVGDPKPWGDAPLLQ